MRLLKGFALAFNMLTIFPFFKVHDFFRGINGYSVAFYPLIGFILGSVLWGAHSLLSGLVPDVHLAVIIFALWVLLTGALHVDGFSDSVDGLFVKKENALKVMKDSSVGGMGMTFTFVFLSLKLSSLIYLEVFYLLPLILMFSRLNASLAIYFYDYVSSGVGALLKEEFVLRYLLFSLAYSLLLAYFFSFLGAFILSAFILILCARFFSARLGGLTGDVYGFIIEVTELALLNYVIIVNFS